MMLLLDQPDLISPLRARRMRFGAERGPRIAILNARGARFEGGGDEPELSLKWIPQGRAQYRSAGKSFALAGDTQLLLNRGQPYELAMREPSESLVVFFSRDLADAAWAAHTGTGEKFGEVRRSQACRRRRCTPHSRACATRRAPTRRPARR